MFVTNWISTTKIQKISEITNFFRHYFLSRTEVLHNQFIGYQPTILFLIAVSLCTGRQSNEEFILSNVPQIAQINTDFLDLCGLGD